MGAQQRTSYDNPLTLDSLHRKMQEMATQNSPLNNTNSVYGNQTDENMLLDRMKMQGVRSWDSAPEARTPGGLDLLLSQRTVTPPDYRGSQDTAAGTIPRTSTTSRDRGTRERISLPVESQIGAFGGNGTLGGAQGSQALEETEKVKIQLSQDPNYLNFIRYFMSLHTPQKLEIIEKKVNQYEWYVHLQEILEWLCMSEEEWEEKV